MPYIVTAELPRDVLSWADGLRRAHFPPERNHLAAHVTLFHAFAPSLLDALKGVLARTAAAHAPPPARIAGVMNLGKGTALKIDSPGIVAIREAVADHFHGALTAQDNHPLRPHITIQNQVTPQEARALQAVLAPALKQTRFHFAGFGLHLYRGGPWEAVGRWSFRGNNPNFDG